MRLAWPLAMLALVTAPLLASFQWFENIGSDAHRASSSALAPNITPAAQPSHEAWGPSPFSTQTSVTDAATDNTTADPAKSHSQSNDTSSRPLPVCGEPPEPPQRGFAEARLPADILRRPGFSAKLSKLVSDLSTGDTRSRAAAMVLEASLLSRVIDFPPCAAESLACAGEVEAWRRRSAEREVAKLKELHQLAQSENEPAVWIVAKELCEAGGEEKTVCLPMPWQRWAQIDPGNGAPWLMIANEAMRSDDEAAFTAAITAGAQSHFIDGRGQGLLRVLEQAEFAPANGWPALAAMHTLLERAGSTPLSYTAVLAYCAADELQRQPARRTPCDAIASLLADRSDSTASRVVGKMIGTDLGWQQDRLLAFTDYLEVAAGITAATTRTWQSNPWSCETSHSIRDVLVDRGIHGDRGWLEERVRKSGRSAQDWAALGRQALAESNAQMTNPVAGKE